MKYKFFIGVIFILGLIFIAKKQQSNLCEKRIDYSNILINKDIDFDAVFTPPEEEELHAILSEWRKQPPKAEHLEIITEINPFHGRKLQILAHQGEDGIHYSALAYPLVFDSTKSYPLLIWANGLNQSDPTVDMRSSGIEALFKQVSPKYFIAIPSFRGQALQLYTRAYCSDGFFGDAFDGASSDALTLMDICLNNYPIDTSRIAAAGVSRGGTVALLMGVRAPEISLVISAAGPTDFLQRAVFERYGRQFRYQFLSHKIPIVDIRKKIIKSSPIHFTDQLDQELYIFHGEKDQVVPIDQAKDLVEKLETDTLKKLKLEYHFYHQKGHNLDFFEEPINILNSFIQ